MAEQNPFDGQKPIPGLEKLGRAIVDADGQPSGSPANFEETRGAGHPRGHSAQARRAHPDMTAAIATDLATAIPDGDDPQPTDEGRDDLRPAPALKPKPRSRARTKKG